MNNLKEAFNRVREDIDYLNQEISSLRIGLEEIRNLIKTLSKNQETYKKELSTHNLEIPTDRQQTDNINSGFKPQNTQYLSISTGNDGASTDRQTDRQTDRHTTISYGDAQNSVDQAVQILDSLDGIKKELRLKFKRLTDQEILVFSSLSSLEEEKGYGDYKTLSERLNLTESSIRDYIGRLIKKGIPIEKNKVNNKYIRLKISANLKKVASLSTILQLRDL